MKDFMVLKILDRFQFILKMLNIDYPVLRKILQVKFIMDRRRVPTMLGNNARKSQNIDKNYFLTALGFYAFMGVLMIVPFVFIIQNTIALMSIVFGILLFMLASTIIADFSSVLLDVKDRTIISTKPVNSKVISMAKFLHIIHFLFLVTFAFAGPGMITFFIKYWVAEGLLYSFLFTLLFIGEIILLNLFIIVITTLLYLLILRFSSGEKLKDIINYVQILMTITITVGYQFIYRIVNFKDLLNVEFTSKWYQYFIIPIWFGAPFELLFKHNYMPQFIVLSILAFVVPVFAFIIFLKFYPTFEDNLLKLNQNQKLGKYKHKKWRLDKLLCRNREEAIFYRFGQQMMKSERDFKLKVYPSLGFSLVLPFIFIIQGNASSKQLLAHNFQFFIYFSAILLPTAIMMLKYSISYKGAWIYQTTPINDLSIASKGVLKAFVVKLLIPIFIFESIIFIFILNITIIPDLIGVFFTMLLFTVICIKMLGRYLPFSEPFENVSQSQGMIVIPLMLIIGFFALIHISLTRLNHGDYLYLGIIFILNLVAWKFGFREVRNK